MPDERSPGVAVLLRSAGEQLDRVAPPVTIDELSTPPVTPESTRQQVHRSWWVPAAAAMVLGVGVAGLWWSIDRRAPVAPTGSLVVEPAPDAAETAPATTVDEVTAEEVTSPTPVPTAATPTTAPTTDEVRATETERLDELLDERASALAELPGFSATFTVDEDEDGRLPIGSLAETRRVTVLADGRGWAEGESGSWWAADRTTGESRHYDLAAGPENASGSAGQLIAAPYIDDPVMNHLLLLGDPTRRIWIGPESRRTFLDVSDVVFDDRPAWRLTQRQVIPATEAVEEHVQTVDLETGLVVEFAAGEVGPDGEMVTRSGWRLTDLDIATSLPDEFPGTFPEDTWVQTVTAPSIGPVPLDEAAASFGPGLVAPAGTEDSDENMLVYDPALDPSAGMADRDQVWIVHREGFLWWTVIVSEFRPGEVETIHVEDGVPCYDVDLDDRCDHYRDGVAGTVETGALAGRRIGYNNEGGLWIFDIGRFIEIQTNDLTGAIELANSLVEVG